MRTILGGVAMVFGLTACGGGGGASGPEDALKGAFAAAKEGNADKLLSFFPTPELMGKVLDCPADNDALAEFAKMKDSVQKGIEELKSIEFVRMDAEKEETKTVAVGEDVRGCKAKAEFKMVKARAIIKDEGGEEDEGVRFFVIDGKYYIAKM